MKTRWRSRLGGITLTVAAVPGLGLLPDDQAENFWGNGSPFGITRASAASATAT